MNPISPDCRLGVAARACGPRWVAALAFAVGEYVAEGRAKAGSPVWNGDPLEDVARLEKVRFIMKEGVVYPAADGAP